MWRRGRRRSSGRVGGSHGQGGSSGPRDIWAWGWPDGPFPAVSAIGGLHLQPPRAHAQQLLLPPRPRRLLFSSTTPCPVAPLRSPPEEHTPPSAAAAPREPKPAQEPPSLPPPPPRPRRTSPTPPAGRPLPACAARSIRSRGRPIGGEKDSHRPPRHRPGPALSCRRLHGHHHPALGRHRHLHGLLRGRRTVLPPPLRTLNRRSEICLVELEPEVEGVRKLLF